MLSDQIKAKNRKKLPSCYPSPSVGDHVSESDNQSPQHFSLGYPWTESLLNDDLMTVNEEMKNSDLGVFLRGNRVKASLFLFCLRVESLDIHLQL